MCSIFLQSTSVLVCSVHVLALYVCTISIVLWYMLCDGFTYFSQTVGVTSALPESVPFTLHLIYRECQASSNEWLYCGNQLLHNRRATPFPHLPSLDDRPSVGFSVGLLIDNTGALHIFFNGMSSKRLATGLPINKHLWGVVDVGGNCSKIKSEMLSGKLDSVSVCDLPFGTYVYVLYHVRIVHICVIMCVFMGLHSTRVHLL